jgi:glutamyl-tRNA reductase
LLARKVPEPEVLASRVVREGLASEAAVISTCNRFEIVSIGGDGGGIRAFFESLLGKHESEGDALYQHLNDSAVRHLYRVSSSLDSMVVGEAQILGQVKRSYQRAVAAGSVGAHLHHLFQSAFGVAKKVRSHTDIAHHGVSLSYVAVRLAEQIFSELKAASVLILGSGEMAELAALHFGAKGCTKIIVANRTVERAAELAERFGGVAVALSDLDRVIDQADIVIGSLAIEEPILTRRALRTRSNDRPIFLIDLGVPRNFAPDLGEVDSVYLYNIDDLSGIADENRALRAAAAQEAEAIIEQGLAHYERWRVKREAQPDIVRLRERVREICASEIERLFPNPAKCEAGQRERLAHAISQKVSHELSALLERRVTNGTALVKPASQLAVVPRKPHE